MKRVLSVLSVCVCFTAGVYAHPPSEIKAEFNPETKILKLTAVHEVKDAKKHFIEMNAVTLNGKKLIRQDFLSQKDMKVQEAVYTVIDAGPDDTIIVKSECNIMGTLEKIFKIADITKK